MKVQRAVLNTLLSLVWTVIFLGPVYVYCVRHIPSKCLYVFAAVGALSFVMPRALLERIQLSPDPEVYRLLRVSLLIAFTQDAPWLRALSSDAKRRVRRDPKAIGSIVRDTWTRERFHLGLLLFCALCAGIALWRIQIIWFVTLNLVNIIYNLYPVWLQQYIRIRVARVAQRKSEI